VKFALERLKDVLHGFVTKLSDFFAKLAVFSAKRGRLVRLIVAMFAVVLLCIILSGAMLVPLTSNYQPSSTDEAPDIKQVEPKPPETKPISNAGSLKTVGIDVYWDDTLTESVTAIDWGILEPGAQNDVAVYFHNNGTSTVTLSEYTSNWNPSAAYNYLTTSWDYDGQPITANESLQVKLTLSVSENITGITEFGFDINVVGTG